MSRTFRAAVAAAALLPVLAHSATADPPNDATHAGGCATEVASHPSVTGQDVFAGVAYGYAVAYSPTAAHNPVTIVRARCEVFVDGSVALSVDMRTAGPLAVLEPTPIQYTAREDQWVVPCLAIDTVDAHGQARSVLTCPDYGWHLPPEESLVDFVDGLAPVFPLLEAAEVDYVDPLVCPVLASLAPGLPGVADITPEGDTTLVGAGPFWDCPPYGNLFVS